MAGLIGPVGRPWALFDWARCYEGSHAGRAAAFAESSRLPLQARPAAHSLKRPAQTISTHVLPEVWERQDPAAARSQNEALHADAHVALQALPQNHAQMRRSNAGTGRAGRNT